MTVCCYVFSEPPIRPESERITEEVVLLLRTITILLQKEKASPFHHKDNPRRLESPRCRRTQYCFRPDAHSSGLSILTRIFQNAGVSSVQKMTILLRTWDTLVSKVHMLQYVVLSEEEHACLTLWQEHIWSFWISSDFELRMIVMFSLSLRS